MLLHIRRGIELLGSGKYRTGSLDHWAIDCLSGRHSTASIFDPVGGTVRFFNSSSLHSASRFFQISDIYLEIKTTFCRVQHPSTSLAELFPLNSTIPHLALWLAKPFLFYLTGGLGTQAEYCIGEWLDFN